MAFDTGKYARSPFLKGDDLEEGEKVVVTIKDAREIEFPDGKTVPALDFLELDQALTLNKTRILKLIDLFGEDTEDWLNQRIALYAVPVQYNGKSVMSVAVGKAPARAVKGKPTLDDDVVYEAPAKRKAAPVAVVEDDDTPF